MTDAVTSGRERFENDGLGLDANGLLMLRSDWTRVVSAMFEPGAPRLDARAQLDAWDGRPSWMIKTGTYPEIGR